MRAGCIPGERPSESRRAQQGPSRPDCAVHRVRCPAARSQGTAVALLRVTLNRPSPRRLGGAREAWLRTCPSQVSEPFVRVNYPSHPCGLALPLFKFAPSSSTPGRAMDAQRPSRSPGSWLPSHDPAIRDSDIPSASDSEANLQSPMPSESVAPPNCPGRQPRGPRASFKRSVRPTRRRSWAGANTAAWPFRVGIA